MTVILIYCDIIDSKLNMGTETNYCGIGQARVHYGICPGSDFIEDEVGNKTEVSNSVLNKGKIDINLVEVINLRDIGNVDVKEEVDSLENRHYDDVGRTRLENIQSQDPLECATPLEKESICRVF